MIAVLISRFKLYLGLAGAVLVMIAVAALRGYQAGREAGRAAQWRAIEKAYQRAQQHSTEARAKTDDALDRELGRWSRGG